MAIPRRHAASLDREALVLHTHYSKMCLRRLVHLVAAILSLGLPLSGDLHILKSHIVSSQPSRLILPAYYASELP